MPQYELAPGTRAFINRPQTAAPNVQIKISTGHRYHGKNSRAWSFVPEGQQAFPRGITRSFEAACLAARTWSHEWFQSLSDVDKERIRRTYPAQNVPHEDGREMAAVRRPAENELGNDRQRQRI